MKSTRANILTIKRDSSNLDTVLDNLKKCDGNILYSNCTSYLRLGKKNSHVQFDTAFYSEKNKTIVLLIHGGQTTQENFKENIEKRNFSYNEVVFSIKKYNNPENNKEVFFARDGQDFDDAVIDSKIKNNDTCTFYPTLKGFFEIRYNSDYRGTIAYDSQKIRGVVEFDDKLIVLINNGENCNVYYKKVLKILSKRDIAVFIDTTESWNKKDKEKQYQKRR